MYSQVMKAYVGKTPLEKLKAKFNRLKKKKENFERRLKELTSEFDKALHLYESKLRITEKVCGSLICDFIARLSELVEDPEILKEQEEENFYEYISQAVRKVYELLPVNEIPEFVKKQYAELFGQEYEDEFRNEMQSLAEAFSQEFGFKGVDFSKINPEDDPYEIFGKIFESITNGRENFINEKQQKKKTKKQIADEIKAKQIEDLQNKNLGNIYKRLAKELHPDLEQDPEKKNEKESLMKQLTAAYENNDLLLLLDLESQCFDQTDFICDETTLDGYNALLKTQTEELEMQINLLFQYPRYIHMVKYTCNYPLNPLEGIERAILNCLLIQETYSSRLKDLSGPSGLKNLKKALKLKQPFLKLERILNLS